MGDFMLFKRERALTSRGFPEYPYAYTHFEAPFVTNFLEANPGSKLLWLQGYAVYHFQHSREAASGNHGGAGGSGVPSPAPKNGENWGLVLLNLSTTVISNLAP
jgi:hypothetical protein